MFRQYLLVPMLVLLAFGAAMVGVRVGFREPQYHPQTLAEAIDYSRQYDVHEQSLLHWVTPFYQCLLLILASTLLSSTIPEASQNLPIKTEIDEKID